MNLISWTLFRLLGRGYLFQMELELEDYEVAMRGVPENKSIG